MPHKNETLSITATLGETQKLNVSAQHLAHTDGLDLTILPCSILSQAPLPITVTCGRYTCYILWVGHTGGRIVLLKNGPKGNGTPVLRVVNDSDGSVRFVGLHNNTSTEERPITLGTPTEPLAYALSKLTSLTLQTLELKEELERLGGWKNTFKHLSPITQVSGRATVESVEQQIAEYSTRIGIYNLAITEPQHPSLQMRSGQTTDVT